MAERGERIVQGNQFARIFGAGGGRKQTFDKRAADEV
jgi:hypothetical protein